MTKEATLLGGLAWGKPNKPGGEPASAVVSAYEALSTENAAMALEALKFSFGGSIREVRVFRNETRVEVVSTDVPEILKWLRDEPELEYKYLSEIAAAEWYKHLQTAERFIYVSYDLYSFKLKSRFYVYCLLPKEAPELTSVADMFTTADWHEREIFDLFGVNFTGHPDLRRILLPAQYDGHPLLKEYPARGKDVWNLGHNVLPSHYDEIIGSII